MIVTRERGGTVGVIRLSGRLATGTRLGEYRERFDELLADGVRRVVVELSDATFIDSAALGEIMACRRRLADRGGRLALAGACGKVKDLLSLTRLDELLETHADLEPALDAMTADGGPA